MLQHVWERASEARYLTSVVIATDDDRIRAAAHKFGARVVMTRDDHMTGTDRVAEAASASDAYWVVNIQGDEPTLDPSAIDAAILGVLDQEGDQAAPMGTLKTRILRPEIVNDPNVVKVVTDHEGNAIYFSRSPIPCIRDKSGDQTVHYKHIGLYIYQRDFLLAYPDLPVGPLETAERLEQLRALENGIKIRVVETDYDALGVDTPEDWQQVVELFEQSSSANTSPNRMRSE
jgi:3-deoxy-manno-octulosonate cytidylyltransferase (CMP-KDO synthetase)